MHSTRESDLADKLRPNVLTLRIILIALPVGVLTFAAVAMVLRTDGNMAPRAAGLQLLTILAMGWTPLALVASRVVPALMTKTARASIIASSRAVGGPSATSETDLLIGQYQTNAIVSAALLEGGAFFNLVANMMEGHPASLGLGIGLAMVILSMFPSSQRMANWIEQQVKLIGEEKMLR